MSFRLERDFLGEVAIPEGALYGPGTKRASENFRLLGQPFSLHAEFVKALGQIKRAAAFANRDLGLLAPGVAGAIAAAAGEMLAGQLNHDLIVDALEGSGGTSINMNVNEVIANRALQLLGARCGEYGAVHPNDMVNRSQSTNDVIPSALSMACFETLGSVCTALADLADALNTRAADFAGDLRLGRTCLQDAQPMMLGQAFGAYAAAMYRHAAELERQRCSFLALPLGATAIGTGLGAPAGFRERALAHLRELTGVVWVSAEDAFDALSNADDFARLSGELRCAALTIGKIGGDLQFLASGPSGGVAELRLAPLQAGSSIMPGKVNPVIPMLMCQTSFVISGYDAIVSAACQHGQLEINPYEPAIIDHLLKSLVLLREVAKRAKSCIETVSPDRERMLASLLGSSAVATALVEELGYDAVSEIVRQAAAEARPFVDVAAEAGHIRCGDLASRMADLARSQSRT